VIPDARGHGRSGAPETGYSREDRIGDILNLINHLGAGRVHLVGHSMGGADAVGFALDYPDRLYTLTLAGPVVAGWIPPRKYHDVSDLAKDKGIEVARADYIDAILSRYKNNADDIRSQLAAMITAFSGKPWTDPMKGKYPIRDDMARIEKIKIPVGIVIGKRDIFFRPLAEILADKIGRARLEIIGGTGHMVNMENPDRFNRALETILGCSPSLG